jgi:Tfp pilus assembly protein PilV
MQRIIIKNKKTNSKKAFSLIEALVAISILMVGILGAFILVVRTLASTPVVQARLVAANLSQEGIELVRKIRDTNFINADDFRKGLENGSWQTD